MPRPPERLETDRLVLRRLDACSVETIHTLFNRVQDEDAVFGFCSWSRHETLEETKTYYTNRATGWENDERYEYIIEKQTTGECIGTTYVDIEQVTDAGVFGLWLDKPHWGNGFSGERADRMLALSFETLGLTHVRVGCLAPNARSRRAIEKYVDRHGGVYYGTLPVAARSYSTYPDPTRPHHEYAIRLEDYETDETGITSMVPTTSYEDIRRGMEASN